jgi:hypothetical protein
MSPIKVAPAQLVSGITRAPLPYGLLSAITIRPSSDRFENGVTWEVDTYNALAGISAPYWDQDPAVGLPKTLTKNRPSSGLSDPFTVYGNFQCSPVGWTPEQAEAAATRHLLAREEHRIEKALWTGDLSNAPALQNGSTTVISGTATKIVQALGYLEKYIGDNYGSQGLIHLTRDAALMGLATQALVTQGGRLLTALGTPVAAGSGYPGTSKTGAAASAGTAWGYVTPSMFAYRSDVFTSTNRSGDLLNRPNNDLYAVAERTYVLGFDPAGVGTTLIDLSGGA